MRGCGQEGVSEGKGREVSCLRVYKASLQWLLCSPTMLFGKWEYLRPMDLYLPLELEPKLGQKECHFNIL